MPPPLDDAAAQTPLAVPNVFISRECERTAIRASSLPATIRETYAQCAEDLIVESLLAARLALTGREPSSLFYVEIGANHPVQTSNTYLFYRKYGAAGVLVEANEELIPALRTVRPRDVVVHSAVSARSDPTLSFGKCELHELSSLALDHIESFGTGAGVDRTLVPNLHINDLLERYVPKPVDFLSIDVEGVDLEILEAIDLSRFRPAVIQCEPSEHFKPGTAWRMVEVLRDRGYLLAARTPVNLIFVDTSHIALRPAVHSFDVFDTLIARRCVDPLRVFAAVEAATGIKGFAQARREAEVAVAGPATTLDGIYAELACRLNLDEAVAASLRQAEIDEELAQTIPITENLAKVNDGDLLLSDMYLPPDVIMQMLQRAGLHKRVSLVVTANGKQSGHVWQQVNASFALRRHLGDNKISDVEVPRRFGIVCQHTGVSEPTPVEEWCLDVGLRRLGELIRAARLRIDSPDPIARRLMLVQTQLNFPMLVLGAAALRRHATEIGADRLLFASRDCHLWHELYDALYPEKIPTSYFYTSRRLRVQPSIAYRTYARQHLTERSILVDLCGTGWSSSCMMETLGLSGRNLYFLHRLKPINLYELRRPTPDICNIAALLGPEKEGLRHVCLEMCNYALHGSAIGMHDVASVAVPVLDVDTRSPPERRLIEQQIACFRGMVQDARQRLVGSSVNGPVSVLADVVARLYSVLSQETCMHIAFGMSHQQEDLQTRGALGLFGG
jgi:FkbM family methyltransferase